MHKKMSPLKHVTPILKKYNCQRQAKNGKSVMLRSPEKEIEQECESSTQPSAKEMVSGMDSLDAALRKAEMCMLGNKDSPDFVPQQSLDLATEDINDQLQDTEEDGISTTLHGSNHQTSTNARSHLRNRSRMLKKRNRLQKDLEHALPLALPDHPVITEEKSAGFALSFFNKVRDCLEEAAFQEFVVNMTEFGASFYSVTDLYHRIIEILKDRPDLCEEFLGFLLPHQALHCGKFMEHLGLAEMTAFLRRLEMHFSKQPQQLRKIFASWARLAETPDLNLETVKSTILPLLKSNTFLINSFLELLPSEKPPESKMTDFDQLVYEEMESEHSGDDEAFEHIEIPPVNDDSYGGDRCKCCCHETLSDVATESRSKHCVPCGLKFISGKIFMQTEHGLRPVQINFNGGGSNNANVKRLNSDPRKLSRSRSRRGRTNTAQVVVKSEDGKTFETDDEACFANKSKSPRNQRPKISKQGREKPTKSLSLSRNVTNRKPNAIKMSSPPAPPSDDQEALPAPDPNEDEKPATLDFSDLSTVLRMDKEGEKAKPVSHENNPQSEMDISSHDDIKLKIDTEEGDDKESEADNVDSHTKEECEDDSVCDIDVDISGESSEAGLDDSNKDSGKNLWTREEDRIILQTFQAESDTDKTLFKISLQLPTRSRDEISSRFQTLMSLIQQMR